MERDPVEVQYAQYGDVDAFYGDALRRYLVDQEGCLLEAIQHFSCAALAQNVSFSELASLHHRTCASILQGADVNDIPQIMAGMEVFFLEVAAVYDSALAGYRRDQKQMLADADLHKKTEGQLKTATREIQLHQERFDRELSERTRQIGDQADALRNENSRLLQTNREQSEFTYAISHDLKAPNNTIKMILQILSEDFSGSLNEEAQTLLGAAMDTTNRMIQIIDDVLHYSQTLGDKTPYETVSLEALLAAIAEDSRADLQQSQGRLEVGDLPDIVCSPLQVRIMFQNFISNAIKFRRKGVAPRIEVFSAARPDKGVDITIRDNGIGIADEYRDRIFGLFQRLHTHDAYPGSGLGLALCRRVAMNHGWDISIASEPGSGSSFCISVNSEQMT